MGLYRDHGVVLRTLRLGEADRIVTLLTHGHGKVRAVARGVRKTLSRFGGRLEPMNHIALQLYEGRELDVVTQTDGIEQFRQVREDLDRLAKAHVLLEVADQVAQERQPNPQLYRMLLGALRALAAHDAPLLVPAFFLKVLVLEGASPMLDACAGCGEAGARAAPQSGEAGARAAPQSGEAGQLVGFDLRHGGALCTTCTHRVNSPRVSPEALGIVARILTGDLVGVLNQPMEPASVEVDRLATHSFEHHLERRLRAVRVLDRA